MIMFNYIASFFLIVLGFYTIVTKTNLVKTVIGLSIADYGVNLLIISIGFNPGGTAPIFTWGELNPASFFVDPIPQALTLTSIVIGACVEPPCPIRITLSMPRESTGSMEPSMAASANS